MGSCTGATRIWLNTDYFTDDFHKNCGSITTFGNYAAFSTHDGSGNITRLKTGANHKGLFETTWSNDFGNAWQSFFIGTYAGQDSIEKIVFLHVGENMILRFAISETLQYDLHINETNISLHKYDGTTWTLLWEK